MNWEAVGSAAELVGAIAVVLSLVYVAMQLRTSMLATRSAVRQASADRMINTLSLQIDSVALAQARTRQDDNEALTSLDKQQIDLYATIWWRTYESIHYQYRNGLYDEDEWNSHARIIRRVFSNNGGGMFLSIRELWKTRSASFSPRFQAVVTEIKDGVADV